MAIECTPAGLKAMYPCLQCLSESELRMAWLLIWMEFGGYDPSDLPELIANAECMTCLSETEKLRAKVAAFGELIFHDVADLQTLINNAECIRCLKKGQVEAITLWLICDFLHTFSELAP